MTLATAKTLAWEAYATGSDGDHFDEFCFNHCRQTVDQWAGQPLELEDWQYEIMAEAFAYDDHDPPRYFWRRIALLLPRKNGKTTMLAAYAVHTLVYQDGNPEVLLAARTDKQAGRLFDAAEMMIRQSPELLDLIHIQGYKGEMGRYDGMGKLYRFSAESGALDGWNPKRVVIDELHAWSTPRERKAWAALVSGFGARKSPQLFAITTAGDPATRADSILGTWLDGTISKGEVERRPGLEIIRDFKSRTLIYNYIAPTTDIMDVESVKLANPASWIDMEFLQSVADSSELTLSQKLRYHANVWASAEDDFINLETWENLRDPSVAAAALVGGSSVGVGLDGSRTYDTTVAAVAAPCEDGRIAVKTTVFSCRKDAPHHVFCPGDKIDFSMFEAHLKDLFQKYAVESGAYDPRYLQRSAEILVDEIGGVNLAEVEPVSTLMRDAIACFYRLVSEGKIVHDGDPVLTAHIAAAKAEQDERGWVIRKRQHSRPIDALVASILAVWRVHVDIVGDDGPWLEVW